VATVRNSWGSKGDVGCREMGRGVFLSAEGGVDDEDLVVGVGAAEVSPTG
jgi:hypothetical protein